MVLKIETDVNVIKQVMNDEVLVKAALPDNEVAAFEAGQWEPDLSKQYLNFNNQAIIKLDPLSNYAVCIHPYLQSKYWGQGVSSILEHDLEEWLVANTNFCKVIVMTPQCCRSVLKAATREGYALEGILTAAILWRANVENLILMSKFLNRGKPNE